MNVFVDRLPEEERRDYWGRRVGGSRQEYEEFAEECKAHQGQWGLFPRSFDNKSQCSNVTTGIKRGEYKDFRPSAEWEAVQRNGKVYVRYLG